MDNEQKIIYQELIDVKVKKTKRVRIMCVGRVGMWVPCGEMGTGWLLMSGGLTSRKTPRGKRILVLPSWHTTE